MVFPGSWSYSAVLPQMASMSTMSTRAQTVGLRVFRGLGVSGLGV